MPKNGVVTHEEFDKIKMLFGYGMKNAQIVETTNRSEDTIRRIKKVETYEDFVSANKASRAKRNIRESEQQAMKFDFQVEPSKEPERRVKYKLELTVWEYNY